MVVAIPSSQTHIQHMQLGVVAGASQEDLIKAQLQMQMGATRTASWSRSVHVANVHRDGQAKRELICMAVGRDTVMRYVDLMKRCKLEVVGMHTEVLAMVRAFDHLHRRDEDEAVSTLYIDLGWGGTRVAISHGPKIVFARYISIGGRHFDQLIAKTLECDLATAAQHRMELKEKLTPATARPPPEPGEMAGAASTRSMKRWPRSSSIHWAPPRRW